MNGTDLAHLQHRFTRAVRSGTCYDPPSGRPAIDEKRMRIYHRLVFNALDALLSGAFPRCRAVLGTQRWSALIHAFLERHPAQTPYFHHLGAELLRFLQRDGCPEADPPPWLVQLMDWEWQEMEVTMDENQPTRNHRPPDPEGRFRLAPTARLKHYDWPVHQARPGEPLPRDETWLIVWRDADDEIHSARPAPAMAALLRTMDGNRTLAQCLLQTAEVFGMKPDRSWSLAAPFIHELLRRGALVDTA